MYLPGTCIQLECTLANQCQQNGQTLDISLTPTPHGKLFTFAGALFTVGHLHAMHGGPPDFLTPWNANSSIVISLQFRK